MEHVMQPIVANTADRYRRKIRMVTTIEFNVVSLVSSHDFPVRKKMDDARQLVDERQVPSAVFHRDDL